MGKILSDAGMDLIFRKARSFNGWLDKPVSEVSLRALYDLTRYGPTSANGSPARFIFVTTEAGKARLKPALSPGNVDKTMSAPVTVIIGYDLRFFDLMPKLFPHEPDAKNWFSDPKNAETTAFRNSSLQGAYLMLAARALGLDCGPMSGFDAAKVEAEFFPGGQVKANFICNIGYGDPASIFARSPRLDFEEACQIV